MDIFKKYYIQVEDWPLYFSDLNPNKHVWVKLIYRLHRNYADVGNSIGGAEKVNARLAEVLPKIWKEILDT